VQYVRFIYQEIQIGGCRCSIASETKEDKNMNIQREITGHYFRHYERGIRSKLTEYADAQYVQVKNGTFRAKLNQTLSERAIDNLLWSLENSLHAFSIRG